MHVPFGHLTQEQLDEIAVVADQYQLPPEFLAAIIVKESGGAWRATGFASNGRQRWLTYVGLERRHVEDIGVDWHAVKTDRRAQVDTLARWVAAQRDGFNIWRWIANILAAGVPGHSRISYAEDIVRWMHYLEEQERRGPSPVARSGK